MSGAQCSTGQMCASGFCVGGICCNSACAGACQACDLMGAVGMCTVTPGATCAAGSCANGVETAARTCDKQGACGPAATKTCAPYPCSGATCGAVCVGPNGCVVGYACSAARCTNLATGLAGRWKLDEGQGTTTADASGNGNDGTLTAGVAWVAGGFSGAKFPNPNALGFNDSAGTYVTMASAASLDFAANQDFTVALWVKTSQPGIPGDFPDLLSKNEGYATGYQLVLHNQDLSSGAWYFHVQGGGSGAVVFGKTNVANDQWHHLAGVRQGDTVITYEDGALANAMTVSSFDLSNPSGLFIGEHASLNPSNALNGVVDDIRIYRRALSVDEVHSLAHGQ